MVAGGYAVSHLEKRVQPVGSGLVRPHHAEIRGAQIELHDVPQEAAQHAGGFGNRGARLGNIHRVMREIGQHQVFQQQAAVGVRVGAHAALAAGRQIRQFGDQLALGIEQLFRPVALHPFFEYPDVLRLRRHVGDRHLVRAPRSFDRQAIHYFGTGPALGSAQHHHRPNARRSWKPCARAPCWIARISSIAVSSVAAMSWCIAAGSSPSTK